MLDASIYVRSINLDVENMRSAKTHGDDEQVEKTFTHFCRTLNYCSDHGLALDTNYDGGLTLRRNGYTPSALLILIDGKDGFDYRRLPNRRAMRYIDYGDPRCEPTYETDHYWEERRAIERDYVELLPWATWGIVGR